MEGAGQGGGERGGPLGGRRGRGEARGGGEGGGTSGLALPLNPPPSRALPRRCRARERGERDAQHHTRCLATACRDARTKPHFPSRDNRVRETPGGDTQPPTADRHTVHPNTVWKGRKGKARTFRLGARAVRDTPPPKEVQAEGHPQSTAHTRAADPQGEERGQHRLGGLYSSSWDTGSQHRPGHPRQGAAEQGGRQEKEKLRHAANTAAHASGHESGGERRKCT